MHRRPEAFNAGLYYNEVLSIQEEPDRICVDTKENHEAIEALIDEC